ncbi:MAG: oligopeptide/dipeptide transporter, ATPase subunit, partial [Rhizobacter sp.]|nr:oligopeptide/dipeptide transporter, ATPase subunit [Rhizobacter sp.]
FVVAMALVAVWGASAWSLVWATAIINLPFYVRLARAEVASRRDASYAWASRLGGAGPVRLLLRTLLPNAMPALVVQASTNLGWAVTNAAGLSFIGLGVRPPTPEWGAMIGEGAPFLLTGQWWLVAFPSTALFLTVWTFMAVGDRLRDRVDPRRRSERRSEALGRRQFGEHQHQHQHEHEHEQAPDEPHLANPRPSAGSSLLSVDSLSIDVVTSAGAARIVDGVTFDIAAGETLALVGESGSGKTMTALALCGLLDPAARIVGGRISFAGRDLARCTELDWQGLRGRHVAMVFQSARRALHPLRPIGEQLTDVLRAHERLSRRVARQQAIALLDEVGFDDAASRLDAVASQLSGGQCQRVMIALALAGRPSLLIADEPTSALDADSRDEVVELLARLGRARGLATLFITHDLALAASRCDRIAVMHAGRIAETAASDVLLALPSHATTKALLRAAPAFARDVGDLRPDGMQGTQAAVHLATGENQPGKVHGEPERSRYTGMAHPSIGRNHDRLD